MTTKRISLYSHVPIITLLMIFLIIKLQSLGIRASDTNIYFYTAKEMLAGKALYRDIFFTNFPVIPYAAVFYNLLSHGSLLFYYFTACLEVMISGFIIYRLSLKSTQSILLSLCSASLFLYSFIILATSDHQSGVFLAALFTLLSFSFFIEKKVLAAGIFATLALLTKAYTLPFFTTIFLMLLIENRKNISRYIIGCLATAGVVLLPAILSGPKNIWHDVFSYSLMRSQGLSKIGIMWFTMQHDLILVLLIISSIFLIKRYRFYGIFSLCSVVFFIFYKDIYYLYLVVTTPILCLFFTELMKDLLKKYPIQLLMIPTVLLVFVSYNFISYFTGYNQLQRLTQLPEMIRVIKAEKPTALYGVNGITPALAHLSQTPLLNNIVDTNDNIFRKGYLDAKVLTNEAIKQHALVITQGVWYPQLGIREDILTDVVIAETIRNNCRVIKRFNFNSEGDTNTIAFYRC